MTKKRPIRVLCALIFIGILLGYLPGGCTPQTLEESEKAVEVSQLEQKRFEDNTSYILAADGVCLAVVYSSRDYNGGGMMQRVVDCCKVRRMLAPSVREKACPQPQPAR